MSNNKIENIESTKNFSSTELISLTQITEILSSIKEDTSIDEITKQIVIDISLNTNNINRLIKNLSISCKYYFRLQRSFAYINKILMKKREIYFGLNDISSRQILIVVLLILIKYINLNQKKNVQNFLNVLFIQSNDHTLFYRGLITVIEIIFKIIISTKKQDQTKLFLKDYPLFFIQNIIKSLIKYNNRCQNDKYNKQKLLMNNDIINIFEKYLTSSKNYYQNIFIFNTPIWLKLLKIIKIIKSNDNTEGNELINLQIPLFNKLNDRIYNFLSKIYKYHLKNEYILNYLFKKSSSDLDFYVKTLTFFKKIIKDENELRKSKNFKILNGFLMPKNKSIFYKTQGFKIDAFSLIFSFQLLIDNNSNIILLDLQSKGKTILIISINSNNHLVITNSVNKQWDTGVSIKKYKPYLVCISQKADQFKIKFRKTKFSLFINEQQSPNFIKENLEVVDIQKITNIKYCECYRYGIDWNFPEFNVNEVICEACKENFEGIFGELFFINKKLNTKNIHHLFNLKGKYASILKNIRNSFNLVMLDNFKYNKYYNDNVDVKFFKEYNYEIKIEFSNNKLNENFYKNLPVFNAENVKFNKLYQIEKDNDVNKKILLYKIKYAVISFYKLSGLDFLSFQLYHIFSIFNNNKNDKINIIFNFYLSKVLDFLFELLLNINEYIFDITDKSKPKVDPKLNMFLLTLITLLYSNNENNNYLLEDEVHNLLTGILDYFRFNNLFYQRNIIYSILFDEKFFMQKKYINSPKHFSIFISDLNDDSNDDISLFNNEFFYKILSLDYIFESKIYKHSTCMKLISEFLLIHKNKKEENSLCKIRKNIIYNFIKYIDSLKSEIKLYHYLKMIYLNSKEFKNLLKNESYENFVQFITIKKEKTKIEHCKYCSYIQILSHLIYQEIFLSTGDNCFHYDPNGFMKCPGFIFIKSVFIQSFDISNKLKFKYIKSPNEMTKNIINFFLVKNDKKKENDENSIDIIKLINFEEYIPKFDAFIDYIKFLFKEYMSLYDKKLQNLIIDTFDLILSFLESLINNYNNILNNSNNKVDINKYKNFISKLLCNEGMRIFYTLYININRKKALDEIKKIIKMSICKYSNCFYFNLLAPTVSLGNDKEENESLKSELLIFILTEISKYKIISIDNNVNNELIKNNIILLTVIYYNITSTSPTSLNITDNIEKFIIIYFNYLVDNHFFYSKFYFNINELNFSSIENIINTTSNYNNNNEEDNNSNDSSNSFNHEAELYKFFGEIGVEVLFNLYEKKNYDYKYSYLIKEFFIAKDKKCFCYIVDEQNYLDDKKLNDFKILNDKKIFLDSNDEYFCGACDKNDVLFCIFFLIYLLDKKNLYVESYLTKKDAKEKEAIQLIENIIENIFNDTKKLYQNYNKKISKFKINDINIKNNFKLYKNMVSLFENKYKSKAFTIDILNDYYTKFKLQIAKNFISERKASGNMNPLNNLTSNKCESPSIGNLLPEDNKNINIENYNSEKTANKAKSSGKLTQISSKNINMSKVFLDSLRMTALYKRNNPNYVEGGNKNSIKSKSLGGFRLREKSNNQNEIQKTKINNNLRHCKLKSELNDIPNYFPRNINNLNNKLNDNNNTFNDILTNIKSINKDGEENRCFDNYNNNYIKKYKKHTPNKTDNLNYINDNQTQRKQRDKKVKFVFEEDIRKIKSEEQLTSESLSQKNIVKMNSEILENKIAEALYKENNKKNNISSAKDNNRISNDRPTRMSSNDDFDENNRNSNVALRNTNNFDEDDLSDFDNSEDESFDINEKIIELNIPLSYYKNIFRLSQKTFIRILFNPKHYYIWNEFALAFKNILFNNKKFSYLKKIFQMYCRKNNVVKCSNNDEKLFLRYPSKIKNFICQDYYRPFLKPYINFFENEFITNTHSYLKENFINKNNEFSRIIYKRLIPFTEKKSKINCEQITNLGSFYGNIYFHHSFILFVSDAENDIRNEKMSEENEIKYLYSFFEDEKIKNKKKYSLIYFNDIKEMFIRRFCFNYIGYEIFTKDNHSYLFNFFNKENFKDFINKFNHYINISNSKKNKEIFSNNTHQINLSSPFINLILENDNNKNEIYVVNEPSNAFESHGYKQKYSKGEISNFKYLLLLNKYSARSYKNNYEYLIFPLLYMNVGRNIERDLSKAISLNKKNCNISDFKFNFQTTGAYFNHHYSNMGYIVYYLVRLIPFTFSHIKLQSGCFDSPERIFTSVKNHLAVLALSDENRELTPELFYNYEMFINLNYLNLGLIKHERIQLNNFDTGFKNPFEFVLNLRQLLEKANIASWVDNIFGYNQFNKNSDVMNIFPLSSYEELHNFDEILIKKKNKLPKAIKRIKSDISLLQLGITPIQLFKNSPHPLLCKDKDKEIAKKKKKINIKALTTFINDFYNNKTTIIYNDDNTYKLILISKFKNNSLIDNNNSNNNNASINLNIFKLCSFDFKSTLNIKINTNKKILNIHPYDNLIAELNPEGIFLICRFDDASINLICEKQFSFYQWNCVVTAVKYLSFNQISSNNNQNTIFINKLILGDEEGLLFVLIINMDYSHKKSSIQIDSFKISKKIRCHNSYIKGIDYIERLNIIISFSKQGLIVINNGHTLDIINMIDLGSMYSIEKIKISDYDLLYINCVKNENKKYIKCYTLNGVKCSKMLIDENFVDYFISNEELLIMNSDGKISKRNLLDFKEEKNEDSLKVVEGKDEEVIEGMKGNVIFSHFSNELKKFIYIYGDKNIAIKEI